MQSWGSWYIETLFLGSDVFIFCLSFHYVIYPSWCLCLADAQLHTNSNVRSENEDQPEAPMLGSPWVTAEASILFLTWQWQTRDNQSLHFDHYEITDHFLDVFISSVMFGNCFKVPLLSILAEGLNQVFLLALKHVESINILLVHLNAWKEYATKYLA